MSQQINLVNPDFRYKRALFTARMLAQALAVLAVLGAGWYAYMFYAVQREELATRVLAGQMAMEQARLDDMVKKYAPRSQDASLEKQVRSLEARVKDDRAVLAVLDGGNLGNTQGYSAYLRAFARQTVPGVWLTGFGIQGAGMNMNMSLGGRTLSPELVPRYLQRLNQEAVTQGRAFAALEMRQPKSAPSADGAPARVPNYLEFTLYSTAQDDAGEGARP